MNIQEIIKWAKSPIVLLLAVTVIAGVFSPINEYKRGGFFQSAKACAIEDKNFFCIILVLGSAALLILGLIYLVMAIRNTLKEEQDRRDRYRGDRRGGPRG